MKYQVDVMELCIGDVWKPRYEVSSRCNGVVYTRCLESRVTKYKVDVMELCIRDVWKAALRSIK